MIASALHFCMSVLFPPRCLGCAQEGDVLCPQCVARSRKTLITPRPYIFSLFDFKERSIRRAIHSIKYYHRRDLVLPLVRATKEKVRGIPGVESYILVPIPMPPMRKLLRGYNQSELIAYALGRELSLPVRPDILKRTRSPLRQVQTATRTERMQNQKGSFAVKGDLSGLRIMLVDDVTTTGATLEEARRVLLSKKAANVLAVTLAH